MLPYLLKASLLLLVLWPALALLLRYSGRFQLNRWVLLLGALAVAALPFLRINSPLPVATERIGGVVNHYGMSEPYRFVGESPYTVHPDGGTETAADGNAVGAIHHAEVADTAVRDRQRRAYHWYYFAGAGLVLLLFGFRLVAVVRAHRRSTPVRHEHRLWRLRGAATGQAYTFGPNVYLSQDVMDGPDFRHVLAHERVHARQWHTLDVVVGELFLALLWFHPVAWWLRARQRANLEYLVDRTVVRGGSRRAYQLALLRQSQAIPAGVALPLPFSAPSLKSRFGMLRRRPQHWLRTTVAVMLLGGWFGFTYGLVGGEVGAVAGAVPVMNECSLSCPDASHDHQERDARYAARTARPDGTFGAFLHAEGLVNADWPSALERVCEPCYYEEVYRERLPEPITKFGLSFRRLPRPDELDQINGILRLIGRTELEIYPSCSGEPDAYDLAMVHYDNRVVGFGNLRDNHLHTAEFRMILLPRTEEEGAPTPERPDPRTGYLKTNAFTVLDPAPGTEEFLVAVNGKVISLDAENPYRAQGLKRELRRAPPLQQRTYVTDEVPASFAALLRPPTVPARAVLECALGAYRDEGAGLDRLSRPIGFGQSLEAWMEGALPADWHGRPVTYYHNGVLREAAALGQVRAGREWTVHAGTVLASPAAPVVVVVEDPNGC